MSEVTLGGDRLGSGNKNKVQLQESSRSNFNVGKVWRSTMSAGTLVPFLSKVALPNSTHEIKLDCDVKTHPTIAPLFGSYKVQLDVFEIPIRLYNSALHMNKLGVGLNMKSIRLPQIRVKGDQPSGRDIDNFQVNPSSLLKYIGISGVGTMKGGGDPTEELERDFNAVPFLAYWDIFKNYYANKQEDNAYFIHNDLQIDSYSFNGQGSVTRNGTPIAGSTFDENESTNGLQYSNQGDIGVRWLVNGYTDQPFETLEVFCQLWSYTEGTFNGYKKVTDIFNNIYVGSTPGGDELVCEGLDPTYFSCLFKGWRIDTDQETIGRGAPKLESFQLKKIDDFREWILTRPTSGTVTIPDDLPTANEWYKSPYVRIFESKTGSTVEGRQRDYAIQNGQEGLAVKTYQSDKFNNWVNSDWLEAAGTGIQDISKVSTANNELYIDDLILGSKIHKMLMRVGVSGGSYRDWQLAVYDNDMWTQAESPVYKGGLIKELAFSEVVSNSEAEGQPLGTLAGRGQMTGKNKGGYIKISTKEPSWIMGIASITPRVDYSQGNAWDMNLKSLDDLHKPQLDQIGFQDLITDEMAWFDTDVSGHGINQDINKFSAGKVPAWLNYMTAVNEIRGNFAIQNNQMFMTLNRRYEYETYVDGDVLIKDLTTYIDPVKFNHVFADTSIDAQNFWVQIKLDITARQKMSTKVIPNL
jgi:hypothetical protein